MDFIVTFHDIVIPLLTSSYHKLNSLEKDKISPTLVEKSPIQKPPPLLFIDYSETCCMSSLRLQQLSTMLPYIFSQNGNHPMSRTEPA